MNWWFFFTVFIHCCDVPQRKHAFRLADKCLNTIDSKIKCFEQLCNGIYSVQCTKHTFCIYTWSKYVPVAGEWLYDIVFFRNSSQIQKYTQTRLKSLYCMLSLYSVEHSVYLYYSISISVDECVWLRIWSRIIIFMCTINCISFHVFKCSCRAI